MYTVPITLALIPLLVSAGPRIADLARSIEQIPPDQRAAALAAQTAHNPEDWRIPAAWMLWDGWRTGCTPIPW
jgi:hypothetical protein